MIPYAQRLQTLTTTLDRHQDSDTVSEQIINVLTEALSLPQGGLDLDRSFADLGVNSLLAVRLLDRINRAFELRMGVEALFSHPSPRRFTTHVAAVLADQSAPVQLLQQKQVATAEVPESAVAIIGYSGRFAGAESPEALWQALVEGRRLLSPLPEFRRSDKTITPPRAGFLADAERFDAAFFGLSNREAAAMDPVQRLFLEQAWCALEHAGLTRSHLAGHNVGVYAGAAGSGHERLVPVTGKAADAYVMTGSLSSMTAARIAYFLDLHGPALTLDTACSSSLLAVHLACQALIQGETEVAIAGGASLFIDERPFQAMQRAGMLSPIQGCQPFDDNADGIAVAEAAACVVLKPLRAALADGDRIEAVIRASAVNQDGRSNGITAPNAAAQAKLLQTALERADIDPASVDLIETHGTGTRLGDPIEAAALYEVFGDRSEDSPLRLAAVKACTGHASEAAGVTGLIATIMALRQRTFTPIAGFSRLNAHLAADGRLKVSSEATLWPAPQNHPRRAGVSAFGLSGTNVHLLLEEAPPSAAIKRSAAGPLPFVLSAANAEDLAGRRVGLAAWLAGPGREADPVDLAHTLMFHREPMACRWAALAGDLNDLRVRLEESEVKTDDPRLQRWLAGEAVDPNWLPNAHGSPLGLPVYPFRGPRLWGGRTLSENISETNTGLLGERQSEQVFLRRFRADEAIVTDHLVAGEPLLHAAVLIEMSLAAARQVVPDAAVTDLAWLKPIVVSADGIPVQTSITVDETGASISMAVDGLEHVKCRAERPPQSVTAQNLDPNALWQTLSVTGSETAAGPGGIHLGPSFPGPDRLRANQAQALAYLERAPIPADFELSPALLDAAIRTAAAVVVAAEAGGSRLRFPARLQALQVLRTIPESNCWLHARRRTQGSARALEQIDVQVSDSDGHPVLILQGLTLVAASEEDIPSPKPSSAVTQRVVWQVQATEAHGSGAQIADLIVATDRNDALAQWLLAAAPDARLLTATDSTETLTAATASLSPRAAVWFLDTSLQQQTGPASTKQLLAVFKTLAASGNQSLVLRIVTCGALAVLPDEVPGNPLAAAVLGLGKAASREFPAWQVRLIDTTDRFDDKLLQRLRDEPGCPLGEPVALRAGQRFVARLLPPEGHPKQTPIKIPKDAHVLILGGMGRLGRVLARHLAQQHSARLSLVGRTALNDERAAFLQELESLGASAHYFAADISQRTLLENAYADAVATHGSPDLVIQAVVDPAFARIENAVPAEFSAALTPKINGLINLGAVLDQHGDAGALAIFSSIGAFTGFPANDGQASYCAACCFEASFAAQLAQRLRKPVKVIHWGLWDSGDFPPEVLARMQTEGLYAMDPTQIGIAFEALLQEPWLQLVHAQLSPSAWLDMGAAVNNLASPAFDTACHAIEAQQTTAEQRSVEAEKTLSAIITVGLADTLQARGLQPNRLLKYSEAIDVLAALPRHRLLAQALLHMAERRGLTQRDGDLIRSIQAPPTVSANIAKQSTGMKAALNLLEHCLQALPQVLSGERPGTDVLFPEGSMTLVEQVYREHPVLAECAGLTGAAVAAAVTNKKGMVRILEIGAGTGATTSVVLAALEAAGLSERYHYLYTDISRAFVRYAHTTFGGRISEPAVLDISRSPAEQGIALNEWDIVLASNVLHATADMHTTLSHVADLLAPQGIVLINETVKPDDFATLTFGLLDGWWSAEDPDSRLLDGPLLSIEGWQTALRRVGLQGRLAYDHTGKKGAAAGGHMLMLACQPNAVEQAPTRQSTPIKSETTASAQTSTGEPAPASIEAVLRERLAAVLDIPVDTIERDRPFTEIGVDSLIAPQIAEDIASELGCSLRVTDIYKYGNLSALATHLLTNHGDSLQLPDTEEKGAEVSPLRRGKTRGGLNEQTLGTTHADAIAIIGLSARLPGAPNLDALWELLAEGRDAITPIQRFDIEPWFDPKGGTNRTYARWGGFLEDYDRFDPYFFNITPVEAEVMDPQQRVLMEETWKAIENAGLDPQTLSGSRCGIFVGASSNNYDAPGSAGLRTLGGSMAILSARMAYVLNLRGPTFPIDTGCSSSLVALHQACQSLRSGECNLALSGGVSVNLIGPEIFVYLSDTGMASPSGACHTFDDAADGFVPGEGAGMVVLKRLSDALADGDRIDALILGSGINQDGRTAGLTAPSAEAQTSLALDIYQRFQLDPSSFGMIEAHGTGTRLGDPIEVNALSEALHHYTQRRGGCAIGSIKTNIGHTMAAAGIAGLAKTVLALQHRMIPASLHYTTPNRHIDLEETPFFVPTDTIPWPEGRDLRAAISSFGFSGTNAHVVLEAAPPQKDDQRDASGPWLFVFSARDADALRRRLTDLADWLRASDDTVDLGRVADTLARGRAHWRYRCALVAAERSELLAKLEQAASATLPTPVPAAHIPTTVAAGDGDLERLASVYEAGDHPDWNALFGARRRPLALPNYPFARERFWGAATAAKSGSTNEKTETYQIEPQHPLLVAHKVGGRHLLPGTFMLELLRSSAAQLTEVHWRRPLERPDRPITLKITTAGEQVTLVDANSTALVQGRRRPAGPVAVAKLSPVSGHTRLNRAQIYAQFAEAGFEYGAALRAIDWVEIGTGAASAKLTPPSSLNTPMLISVALLDGALQTAAAIGFGTESVGTEHWVPHGLGALQVWQQPQGSCRVNACLQSSDDPDTLLFNVELSSEEGEILAAFEQLSARRLPADVVETYVPVWHPTSSAQRQEPATVVMVGADANIEIALRSRYSTLLRLDPSEQDLADRLAELAGPLLVVQTIQNITLADDPVSVASGLVALDPLPPLHQAMQLAQALIRAGRADGATLLSGAVGDGAAELAARAIAGLYRTLRLEAPAISARVILAEDSQTLASALVQEAVTTDADDPLIRYPSEQEREYASWSPITVPSITDQPTDKNGVIVITGGCGGIGLALARHLAGQGAARLVLIGRSEPDASACATIREMEAQRATVLSICADVGDVSGLRDALASIRRVLGPITEVYHLAGQLHDAFLLHKTEQELTDLISGKAYGAILLDLLTRQDSLQSFVLFGSTAAVFGAIGQADYAAANAFLEAFSERREQQRLAGLRSGRTLCLSWPLWAAGRMQPTADGLNTLAAVGLTPMASDTGFAIMTKLLATDTARALVLHGRSGLFERLWKPTTTRVASIANNAPKQNTVLDYLCVVLSEITKIPPARIEPDTPFDELGIDSIMIMKLNSRLEADLGAIAKTLFFEFQTPESLALHLSQTKASELAALLAPSESVTVDTADSREIRVVTRPSHSEDTAVDEAIAIIGLAGLYPEATDLADFWRNLQQGRDCISEIPEERWPIAGFYSSERDNPATSHCKWGGFIKDADCFDARFFGIAPLEAETIDPQARKFLEIAWNTLENAGVTPERMFDSLPEHEQSRRACGVFVGVMYGDYQLFGPEQAQHGHLIGPNADYWNIANRVSAFLDIHGPSMAIDSACSSSLSAIHLACQAIRAGDCALAIAGGVNLCLHPRRHWILSKAGMAASDGRCHSFGAEGDGYVPGEGIGAVLLKPLAQARADGDRIQGVILGSAVNHGGRTSGYTVPNPLAQGELITEALERAQVPAQSISFIEAHGTGTPLGDPIEIRGIIKAFEGREPVSCAIGSVKANIGHLESAAGIAGLTKVLLQMQHRELVPTPHADKPNPDLNLAGSPFRIQLQHEPWQADTPLRAGISSFGAGGANAHLIVAAEPAETSVPDDDTVPVFLLSAKDPAALQRRAGQLAGHLASEMGQQQTLRDIAYTLICGRTALRYRLAVSATDRAELIAALQRFADQGEEQSPILLLGTADKRTQTPFDSDNPQALTRAWVAGAEISSLNLPEARRVELPAYPFARRRLWVALSDRKDSDIAKTANRTFRRDAAPVCDHRIADRFLVPGASSLLLALEVVDNAMLADIAWPTAVVLQNNEPLTLTAHRDQDHIKVTTENGSVALTARYAASEASKPDLINRAALAEGELINGESVYTALARIGAHYGPSLQALSEVLRGEGIALARLKPGYSADAIIDAALQLTFALIPDSLAGRALLPAGAEHLTVSGSLESVCTVLAQRRINTAQGITLNLNLLDVSDTSVAWIQGLQVRAQSASTKSTLRLFRPEWSVLQATGTFRKPDIVITQQSDDPVAATLARYWSATLQPLTESMTCERADAVAIVLGAESSSLDAAVEQTERVLAQLLSFLRTWIAQDAAPALLLITRGAQADMLDEQGSMGAATTAFVRAAAREREDAQAVTLNLPDNAWQPEIVLAAVQTGFSLERNTDPVPRERAWRDGLLLERILAPLTLPQPTVQPWRDGDVLLIAGAGGLGCLLARHAASMADIAVALIGRRAQPNQETAQTLAALKALGRRALYLQADLADAKAVNIAVERARNTFGDITWAVHTALVMGDAAINELTFETLNAVLAPKTHGLANLARAFTGHVLRGFVVFSSSNALTANPGQAAYAAASAFIDSATLVQSANWPVHVLDWGFWGETGAVADLGHQASLGRLGVLPITNQEGLAALETVLVHGLRRTVALSVEERLLEPLGVDKQRAVKLRDLDAKSIELASRTVTQVRQAVADSQRFANPNLDTLNQFAARRLLSALGNIKPGMALDRKALTLQLAAAPAYQLLMAALADMLQRAGLSDSNSRATDLVTTVDSVSLARERQTLEREAPATIATLALMDRCLQALDEVVSGRRDAATVLFPEGDVSAVEAIYSGNPIVDHFQHLSAVAVAAAVDQLLQERSGPVRILEVGAGTGATSGFVLEALAQLGAPSDRLWYYLSDIGASLVAATGSRLQQRYPFIKTGRLDVTQALGAQHIEPASIDIVIAANVLHATADLLTTLANVKEALVPGGLLVLNEATSGQDINTVTFGLTPGWWAFRDAARRLPHGPVLNPQRWTRILVEAGFSVTGCFGLPLEDGREHALQSLIVAAADGFTPDRARRGLVETTVAPVQRQTDTASGDLEESLRQLVSETLRLEDDELGLDDSFAEYGADSILSVELVRRINECFGIDLKSTALFNYATVRELARYMIVEHGVAPEPVVASEVNQITQAKQRSERLLDVIKRRREATPLNKEAEFWNQEEASSTPVQSESVESTTNALDELLKRLERGEISVSEAMELHHDEP